VVAVVSAVRYALPQVERGTFLVIRTDGTEEVRRIHPSASAICTAIGCTTLDVVHIGRAAGSDLMMSVDDNGWETKMVDHGWGRVEIKATTPRKPVNAKATALYHAICRPGTTHQIVGDVALAHDEDFA
jgi:hypothetical protein